MNIIALNGYAESGKDTIGRIIQFAKAKERAKGEATMKALLKQGPGEDYNYTRMSGGWEIKKYAEKLKKVASILTGIPREKFEDQSFKDMPLPRQWDIWCVEFANDGEQYGCFSTKDEALEYERNERRALQWDKTLRTNIVSKPLTVREFLQKLGTDACRYGLHPNVWVNALFADYDDDSKWIITDCRFENEAIGIKERGGIIVRINRPGTSPKNRHESETALDGWEFDYTITNDCSIDELVAKVEVMLNSVNYNSIVEY